MPEPMHTYPSLYPPGTSWAFDEAWAILDVLPHGMLDHEARAYVAGMIAGTLTRVVGAAAPGGDSAMSEETTPGQVAYRAFARARQLEHELALWGLLPPYMREAWEAAAQAVLTMQKEEEP